LVSFHTKSKEHRSNSAKICVILLRESFGRMELKRAWMLFMFISNEPLQSAKP